MSEEGKLAEHAALDEVDQWSRDFYAEFRDWPLAKHHGSWSTWSGQHGSANYLLLEVIAPSDTGELSDPIAIYSEFEEITFATRVWHQHYDGSDAAEVQRDVSRWLAGEFLIAVFYEDDAWRGSMTISPGDPIDGEPQRWLAELCELGFHPNRLEVRGPFKSKDRNYRVVGSSIVL